MREGGMEVGEEGEYIPIAALSPPEWPALRWAVMRAILMFHYLWRIKSQDSVHKPQFLKRKENRSGIETRSFRLPAYRLTARPNRLSTQKGPSNKTINWGPSCVRFSEFRSCVKVEVAVLGFPSNEPYSFCGRKATLNRASALVTVCP